MLPGDGAHAAVTSPVGTRRRLLLGNGVQQLGYAGLVLLFDLAGAAPGQARGTDERIAVSGHVALMTVFLLLPTIFGVYLIAPSEPERAWMLPRTQLLERGGSEREGARGEGGGCGETAASFSMQAPDRPHLRVRRVRGAIQPPDLSGAAGRSSSHRGARPRAATRPCRTSRMGLSCHTSTASLTYKQQTGRSLTSCTFGSSLTSSTQPPCSQIGSRRIFF